MSKPRDQYELRYEFWQQAEPEMLPQTWHKLAERDDMILAEAMFVFHRRLANLWHALIDALTGGTK